MSEPSASFRLFLIRPWHSPATKLHSHLDDGVEHVPGVIAAIQDAAAIYNSRAPANSVEIVFDENTMQPGATILEQLYVALQQCDVTIVVLDGLRPNVVFEYGMILGMLRAKREQTARVIAIRAADATVLVRNYYPEATKVPSADGDAARIINPTLDVGRHFSDIAGLFVYHYDRHQVIRTVRQWFVNYFSKELVALGPPRSLVSTDDATDGSAEEAPGAVEAAPAQPAGDVWQSYRAGEYDAIIDAADTIDAPRDLKALALAYMKRSRIHDALRVWMRLQAMISEMPSGSEKSLEFSVKLHLGICYYILGQHALAIQNLEKAKSLATSGGANLKVEKWLTRAQRYSPVVVVPKAPSEGPPGGPENASKEARGEKKA